VNPYAVAALAFTVVMLGMACLTLLCFGMRWLVRPAAPVPGPAAGLDDPLLLALLAAAASEALAAPVRIHAVHLHRGPGAEAWSRAGRMDVMISHRVEPRR
jgi:hypothetical protein